MHDRQLTASFDLTIALSDPMDVLRDAVASLEAGLGGDAQIRSITSTLISTWHLIERDPGFEVAAADLLAAARQLASPIPATAPARLQRLLREAQKRLLERLASARVVSARACAAPASTKNNGALCPPQSPATGVESLPPMARTAAVDDDAADIAALARSLAPRMAA